MEAKPLCLSFICALLLSAPLAPLREARAEEPQAMACPKCGHAGGTKFCSEDGAPLVRSDLVVFHRVVSLLATGEVHEPGFQNPFKPLLLKDGTIDQEALARLVRDYGEAAKTSPFSS